MNKLYFLSYIKAYIRNVLDFIIFKKRKKNIPKKYYNKEILDIQSGSHYIEDLILRNEPFCVARFGSTELGCFHNYIKINQGLVKDFKKEVKYGMKTYAGFFPSNTINLYKYGNMVEDMYASIDLLACFNIFMEDFIVDKYCSNAKLTTLKAVDPILSSWTRALEGKKVLVIHPFADLIQDQYKMRNYIFDDPNKLPKCDLKTYSAVQTIAEENDSRFDTWFNALDFMIEEIKEIDFDIALIAAGAYGLPLSVRIKTELNKSSIHCGGSLQLLFGIKGKRWDNRGDINCYYNQYWIRPEGKFLPKNKDKVEGGCYW